MARFTESQWAAVKATLPSGVDEAWFRGELERIASDTSSPKRRERIYLDRARLCAQMSRELPGMEHIGDKDALSEQLKCQQREDSYRGKIYGHIAAQRQPRRFLQQCNVLQLWQHVGGALGINTPRRKKDDPHNPLPTGAVIPYFQAAAMAVWGKAPSAHQIKKIVPRYRRFFKTASSNIASFSMVKVDPT
jgi:hypothetical protein